MFLSKKAVVTRGSSQDSPLISTVTGPVWEHLQAGTKDAHVLDCPVPLRRFHDSGTKYKYPDLLTYLISKSSLRTFQGHSRTSCRRVKDHWSTTKLHNCILLLYACTWRNFNTQCGFIRHMFTRQKQRNKTATLTIWHTLLFHNIRMTTLQTMWNSLTIRGNRHVNCYSYHARTSVTVSSGGRNATVHDPKPYT